jgi:hypothetical protein
MEVPAPFLLSHEDIYVLPVLHDRLECAATVREAVEALAPRGLVVEIPSSLERLWLQAVGRLPALSFLVFEASEKRTIYLPVHPADPMTEAARLAAERGLALACGDLDVDGYGDWRDPVPDAYAIQRVGLRAVFEVFRSVPRPADPEDGRRETALAHHAQRLREEHGGPVLVVCGMHHAQAVAEALAVPQAIPMTLPRRMGARLVHPDPAGLAEVLPEPPFYAAAWEAFRSGRISTEPEPAPTAAGRTLGPFRVLSGGKGDPDRVRAAVAQTAGRSRGGAGLDRLRLQWALVCEAAASLLAAAHDERVEGWQRGNLPRLTRNLTRLSGALLPDLYDLVLAARGCVSDNYAWELHRLAAAYPDQAEAAADVPTAKIRAEHLWQSLRSLRLHQRLRRPKQRGLDALLRRRRPGERYPGEWLDGFDENAICSYPPEDIVVEEFGRYLKRRGKSILSEERARSVPFTTSVLDGIDLRETLRHLADRRLWVRELGRVPGEVGPVVVVFEDERRGAAEQRYPYMLTWMGEHSQESDMAFYATDPAQGIVGPGICRVTYGGFLLSYPPGRLGEIWNDPDYAFAETKAEVLLLAALDYAQERIVVHLGARPPRGIFQSLAGRLDRKILHVPLGTLSPGTLRRLRVMHVLAGHDKRAVAKDYVW